MKAKFTSQDMKAAKERLTKVYNWMCSYSAYYGVKTPEQIQAEAEYVSASQAIVEIARKLDYPEDTIKWMKDNPHMVARGFVIPA